MLLAPFLFKAKAVQSLKGNWQTALLVTFFSGIFTTGVSLAYTLLIPDLSSYTSPQRMLAAIEAVPEGTWTLLSVLSLVAFLITPILQIGANHYFISRLKGMELGFGGLLSRVGLWGKALWLTILIGVKVFLWSLLLVVPGIIAGIRYSMAYYYLAEDPSLTAWGALEKSKNAMQSTKMSYFALSISFLGWMFLSIFLPSLLVSMGFILAQVVSLGMNLFVNTYMNGAYAAFFLVVSDPQGLEKLHRAASMMGRGPGSPLGAWPGPQGEGLQGEGSQEQEPREAPSWDSPAGEEPTQEGDASQEGEPSREKSPSQDPGEE